MSLKSELKTAIENNTNHKVKKISSIQVVKSGGKNMLWIDIELKY